MSLFARRLATASSQDTIEPVPAVEPPADGDDPLPAGAALALVGRSLNWPVGHAWGRINGSWRSTGDWWLADPERFEALRAVTDACDLGPGRGVIAAVLHLEACRFLPDLSGLGSDGRRQAAQAAGLAAVVGIPVVDRGAVAMVLEFVLDQPIEATDLLAERLRLVAERVVVRPAMPAQRKAAS